MLFSAAECFNGRIPELSRAPVTRPGDLSASHGAQPRISRCRVTCHQLIQLRKSAKCGCGYLQTSREPTPWLDQQKTRLSDCEKKILANWWIFLQCLYRWCPVAQRECNLARTAYSAPESLEIMASPWNRGQANSLPCRVNLKWSFVEIQIVWDAVELHLSIILFNGGLICLFIILGKSLTPNQLCSFPYCNLQLTLSIDALHHESR